IMGRKATSVFASFAPCQDPKLVVVVMLPDSGFGADAAAPAVRKIWDGIYGLEGSQAALPGGRLTTLPEVRRWGSGARHAAGPVRGPARSRQSAGRRWSARSPRAGWPGPGTGC